MPWHLSSSHHGDVRRGRGANGLMDAARRQCRTFQPDRRGSKQCSRGSHRGHNRGLCVACGRTPSVLRRSRHRPHPAPARFKIVFPPRRAGGAQWLELALAMPRARAARTTSLVPFRYEDVGGYRMPWALLSNCVSAPSSQLSQCSEQVPPCWHTAASHSSELGPCSAA